MHLTQLLPLWCHRIHWGCTSISILKLIMSISVAVVGVFVVLHNGQIPFIIKHSKDTNKPYGMLQVKHTMVVIIIIILIIAMHAHCHWGADTHKTESQAQFIYISNTSCQNKSCRKLYRVSLPVHALPVFLSMKFYEMCMKC